MLISWFTVIAQIINFLILVWLLKRYLYKPILNAIEEREKKISLQLKDAEFQKMEAEKERKEYQHKNESLEQHKNELIKEAINEASEERIQLLDEARKELIGLKLKQEEFLKEEQKNIGIKIVMKTREEVFAIARKTLLDLASLPLENYIVQNFINRLNDGQEKNIFSTAFHSSSGKVKIQSAFDLAPDQKNEIEKSVDNLTGKQVNFQYEISKDLMGGIQMSTEGYKLEWSISAYLDSLEKNIQMAYIGNLKSK